ncbi:hypothetical protein GALMADRAFT_138715 [Galerina marginata CBS 339.88]|uniref:Mid2 domain-containing protein n=1 Tax=Galerina marginata (strain CBS 339.88) TaxID=685588 RepID=A0A067TCL4_GALM3|nr:hypothetical protein GALMADRAFT_138715 [Galerina marginata CBS 339.88]
MIVTLKQSAFFLLIVSLTPAANAILSFHYRFYNNNACNHDAPSQDTFPLNGLGPLLGSQNQCLSAPQNGNWTTVELDNSVDTGGLMLITFCNINCEGGGSSPQSNARCFIAAPNCFIESFSVSQTTSGSETSPSTLPLSTSPSLPTHPPSSLSTQPSSSSSTHPSSTSSTQSLRGSSIQSSSSSSTQTSNTSNSMPSTVIVTQTPVGVGSSFSTQSSKPKVSKGTVAGGAVGGVLAIAGLAFLLFFLLRRTKKQQLVLPYGIPTLSRPSSSSHAAATIDETHPMSLTSIPVQTTGKFVREDHNFRASVVVSYDEHLSPLNSGPDTPQIHRHDDSGVRFFSRTGGSTVQLPPLYTRG